MGQQIIIDDSSGEQRWKPGSRHRLEHVVEWDRRAGGTTIP
jgi:hypothetical protein